MVQVIDAPRVDLFGEGLESILDSTFEAIVKRNSYFSSDLTMRSSKESGSYIIEYVVRKNLGNIDVYTICTCKDREIANDIIGDIKAMITLYKSQS